MRLLKRLIPFISLLICISGCFFKADSIVTEGMDKDKIQINRDSDSTGSLSASLTKVSIVNDQLVLEGDGLDDVDSVRIEGPSGFDEFFSIESKTASKIVANGLKDLSFLVGALFDLTLSNAYGAATFQVTFTLQDGAVTASKLSDMGAGVGQVLKYDGTTWVPSDLNSLTYAGNWDANTNTPDLTIGGSLGEYYIVSNAGSTDLMGGTGTNSWAVGDWAVWNNVDARWEKVDNATNVTSFNGRNGPVSPQSGDYTISQIANDTGYLDYQPTGTACSDGQVLKYDSTLPGWKCDNDIDTTSSGDITSVNAGTALTGGALSGDATLSVDVGTNAGQIPQLQTGGLLDPVVIPSLDASKIGSGTMATVRLPYAGSTTDGIITSTDYTNFSSKEGTITAGTTAQYWRGDKSWQTLDTLVVPENGNLYFTDARAQAAVVSPLISDGVTNLSPSEDAVFDALALKQDTLTNTTNAEVGTVRIYDSVDQSNYVELKAPDMTANLVLTLPGVDGTSGQVLSTNGSGALSWITPSSGVTDVTATAPISSTGGATPDISISQATSTTDGYLSSTDWNTFNNKEGTITAGTTAQYFRGDKSWQTLDTLVVPENGNLYFTDARAQAAVVTQTITDAVTATSPSEDAVFDALALKENAITAGTTAQYFRGDKSWQTLDTLVVPENGNLYFTDARAQAAVVTQTITDTVTSTSPSEDAVFDALALKQDTLTSTTNATVGTVRIYDSVDQSNYVELKAPDMAANLVLTLPGVDGTSGQVLTTDGAGNLAWSSSGSGSVTSVTATAPLSSTGGTTPDISISQATSTTNGYLTSTDWNTFNNKEGAIASGTTAQYWRGDKSWQSLDTLVVPENGNLYFTDARAQAAVVTQTITDAVTATSPSEDAVFDALALKIDTTTAESNYVNVSGDTMTGALNLPTDGLVAGTSQFVLASGKVGVGTSTPERKLHVSNGRTLLQPSSETYALGLGRTDSTGAFWLGVNNSNTPDFLMQNSLGTEIMRVTNSGKVGIGTQVPKGIMEVSTGSSALTGTVDISGATTVLGTGTNFTTALSVGDRVIIDGENKEVSSITSDTELSVSTAMTNTKTGIVIHKSAFIVTDGNVGIGTIAPRSQLEIDGDVQVGNEGVSCNTNKEGSMRYNSSTKSMEFCDGVSWNPIVKKSASPTLYSSQISTGQVNCGTYLQSMSFSGTAGQRVEITVTHNGRPVITSSGGHFYNSLYLNGSLVDSAGTFTNSSWRSQVVTNYSGTLASTGTHIVQAYLDCGNGTSAIKDSTEWPNGNLHYRVWVMD